MPPGICAATFASGFPFGGYSRVAELTVEIMGMERQLHMAGMAVARFPDRSDDQLRALPTGDEFRVIWDDAIFVGHDWLLGDITAEIPKEQFSRAAIGTIRSVASPPATRTFGAEEGEGFFPAINENHFFFDLRIPRLGIVMSSPAPIVNSSQIRKIPPFGSIYQLSDEVSYKSDLQRSGLLGQVSPKVVIKTCNVRLQIEGGIKCELELLGEGETTARYRVKLQNVSGSDELKATLAIWPRPEEEVNGWIKPITLGRNVTTHDFEIPRDIFFRSRWLVAIGAKPFDEDALTAVRFPPLS